MMTVASIKVHTVNDEAITFVKPAEGFVLPVSVVMVYATGTGGGNFRSNSFKLKINIKNNIMPNISKKTAYDVKEASNQSLSKSARKHYAENAQAGSKSDSKHGSWISKHMS